jgi:hypothetical protein
MGQTRVEEIKQKLGTPSAQTPSKSAKGVTYLEYTGRGDKLKFQARAGLIEAEFRDPVPGSPQSTLQYWRHRWKGQNTTYGPVKSPSTHEAKFMQFSAPDLGAAVVYDPSADRVTRVVRYAR